MYIYVCENKSLWDERVEKLAGGEKDRRPKVETSRICGNQCQTN